MPSYMASISDHDRDIVNEKECTSPSSTVDSTLVGIAVAVVTVLSSFICMACHLLVEFTSMYLISGSF